jgi:hypothetical protein
MAKKRRLHHHGAETEAAERELARLYRREEDQRARLSRRQDANAVNLAHRKDVLKAAGVVLLVAALVAVVGTVVWSFL